jgi:TRAP-type transport system small permease protein
MPSERKDGSRNAGTVQRTSRGLVLAEVSIICLLFIFMVYSVLTQVISRYLLNSPSPWTEEAARYTFVWLSMLGAALGVERQSHFGFDVAVRALPIAVAKGARVLAMCIIFAVAALLAWEGWKLMQLEKFSTGPATNIPMAWVYAAIPVGAILIMAHILLDFLGARPEGGPIGDIEDALVHIGHELDISIPGK